MKMRSLLLILAAVPLFAADAPFDWQKAREIFQRFQSGAQLTPEEQKFLDEAKRRHDAGESPDGAPQQPPANPGTPNAAGQIDWEKARSLYEREQKGEKLSPEDQKYLDEAKRRHAAGEGPGGTPQQPPANPGTPNAAGQIDWERARSLYEREQKGEKLSPEDQKYLDNAKRLRGQGGQGGQGGQQRNQEPPPPPPENLVPLTELTGQYQGQDGGLYGGGKNEPSPELAARAKQTVAQIRPLNAEGKPAADGKIVMVSLGMSNTTMEFSTFKRLADEDPHKAANLVIVDCAQGGRTASAWATNDQPWEVAVTRIQAAGVTPAQVQVMWIKEANAGPSTGWPAATDQLRDDIRADLKRAREKYPNLRLVFLSSRIYAGYATTRLNPEPYAYEGAFAVRAVIRDQSSDGPVLLWGPYLWTNGEKGRALDDLKWTREDCGTDGTHPSPKGQEKVAHLLLDFFTKNPNAKPWFAKPS